MSKDKGSLSSDSSKNAKEDLFSNVKVNNCTQVDSDHSSTDVRKIVGQEDESEPNSKNLQDLSFRKQNKGVRPPLVGQASSSSSNDSMSYDERHNDEDNNEHNAPNNQIETFSEHDGVHVSVNYTRGSYIPTPFLLNREEYINHRPPEGSSEHVGIMIQPLDNIQECPRIRSPSSASSVTSSKPLEWDSGADVGYNQVYSVSAQQSESSMSTIERMALACGTNLLKRSDPEGTTGPNGKPPNILKNSGLINPKYKSRLGTPNAESTPLGTGVLTNRPSSPEALSEGVISPINNDSNNVSHTSTSPDIRPNEDRQIKTIVKAQTEKCTNTFKPVESKIPLFPELQLLPTSANRETNHVERGISRYSNYQLRVAEVDHSTNNYENPDSDNNNKPISYIVDTKNKSSSLENVSTIKHDPLNNSYHSNTLPRSQSQTSLHLNELPDPNTEGQSNCTKYSMAFHNLVQVNKSASSSSVATVVHKKGESPKHVFSQTSYKKESIGIQVSNGKDVAKSDYCSRQFTETPHVPRSQPLRNGPKRSNYFNFDSTKECPSLEINIHDNIKPAGNYKIAPNDNNMSHCQDGIPCLGAHRKVQHTEQIRVEEGSDNYNSVNFKQVRSSIRANVKTCSKLNESVSQGMVNYTGNNKRVTGVGTAESRESSTKSGGCFTDKHYSVTGEDRVNSFEYLPGHIYENSEKQGPLDSRETSSISIHNETSNNETPDDNNKLWDSSASTVSSLDKDVQKGVDIISEFVRGSCGHDSILKKKLIRRVVEKLITKNYNDDKIEHIDLKSNVPWVPSQPPNIIERNGREGRKTRRSLTRSKVPCEFSSRSEKSLSTNASSECFVPKPAANSTFLPSKLRDNTCSGQISHSSTSEISVEKKNHGRLPPPPVDIKAQVIHYGSISKDLSDSSNKPPRSTNWREPATKMEKLLEERKKKNYSMDESYNSQSDAMTLVEYLNMERENQLFWIRSEIQHLSNLKELLEKQEELKRGIHGLKKSKQKVPGRDILKDKNRERNDRGNERSNKTDKPEMYRKISTPKTGKKYQPTLNAWLERTAADSKTSTVSSATTEGMEDWTSHNYRNDNYDNLRSCMKRKPKKNSFGDDREVLSTKERDAVLYDEPNIHSYRRDTKEERVRKVEVQAKASSSTPFRPRRSSSSHVDGSFFVTEEGVAKRNAQTETLDTVGVQTSHSVEQLPVVHPNWFRHKCGVPQETHVCNHVCQCQCSCSRNCRCEGKSTRSTTGAKEQVEKPGPVGYFITFEPSPRSQDAPLVKPLEEVRIPVPMCEPKVKSSRRLRPGLDRRETERIIEGSESGSDKERVDVNSDSQDSDTFRRPYSEKPTLQGAKGLLQYYLLRNRPSYVSRAEDRRQCIAQMQYLRELREQSKRRLLSLTDHVEAPPPAPPPLGVRRVFSQQSMRRQTEKKYRQLAEVQSRQLDTKRKQGYRTNKLMADIFNKKLQKRVLKGEVNLSNSVSVISSI